MNNVLKFRDYVENEGKIGRIMMGRVEGGNALNFERLGGAWETETIPYCGVVVFTTDLQLFETDRTFQIFIGIRPRRVIVENEAVYRSPIPEYFISDSSLIIKEMAGETPVESVKISDDDDAQSNIPIKYKFSEEFMNKACGISPNNEFIKDPVFFSSYVLHSYINVIGNRHIVPTAETVMEHIAFEVMGGSRKNDSKGTMFGLSLWKSFPIFTAGRSGRALLSPPECSIIQRQENTVPMPINHLNAGVRFLVFRTRESRYSEIDQFRDAKEVVDTFLNNRCDKEAAKRTGFTAISYLVRIMEKTAVVMPISIAKFLSTKRFHPIHKPFIVENVDIDEVAIKIEGIVGFATPREIDVDRMIENGKVTWISLEVARELIF